MTTTLETPTRPKYKPYSEYKDSGVEWLDDIPAHWDMKRLKYKSLINSKVLPETTPPDYEITYIDIGSVNSDGTLNGLQTMFFDDAPSRARRVVSDGDVLISTVRTYLRAITHIPLASPGLIASTGFAVITPCVRYNPKFLYYWSSSKAFVEQIVARSVGVSYPAINASEIGNLEIPEIDPSEQTAIANFLDRETAKIDALIEKKRRLIELLEEKRTALISHAVTKGLDPNAHMKDSGVEWLGEIPAHWEVAYIKRVSSRVGSGKTPRGGSEVYSDTGVIFLRSQNVHFDGLRLDDVVFIDEEIDADMASTRVLPKDILLNITGASLGRSTIVPHEIGPANVNQHVCIIRPSEGSIDPHFLARTMTSTVVQSQIFSLENGTSREGLNFAQVRDLWFPAPVLMDEQTSIAKFLDSETSKIDNLKKKNLQAIDKLREYRTALVSAAVTGKIDVRGEVA